VCWVESVGIESDGVVGWIVEGEVGSVGCVEVVNSC
jgi:hypothetical protein